MAEGQCLISNGFSLKSLLPRIHCSFLKGNSSNFVECSERAVKIWIIINSLPYRVLKSISVGFRTQICTDIQRRWKVNEAEGAETVAYSLTDIIQNPAQPQGCHQRFWSLWKNIILGPHRSPMQATVTNHTWKTHLTIPNINNKYAFIGWNLYWSPMLITSYIV